MSAVLVVLFLWLWFNQTIGLNQSYIDIIDRLNYTKSDYNGLNGRRRLPSNAKAKLTTAWKSGSPHTVKDFEHGTLEHLGSLQFLRGVALIATGTGMDHSFCTGTLIKPPENDAPNGLYVLTASHCLWIIKGDEQNPTSKWWDANIDNYYVYFGVTEDKWIQKKEYMMRCSVTDGIANQGFVYADDPHKKWANDYAILFIETCKDQLGTTTYPDSDLDPLRFGITTYSDGFFKAGDKLWVAGYKGGWSMDLRRVTRQTKEWKNYDGAKKSEKKATKKLYKGTLNTDDAGMAGDSGGPYWRQDDSDHKINAVFCGSDYMTPGGGGIGVKIKANVIKNINNYIKKKDGISYKLFHIPKCNDGNTANNVKCWSNCVNDNVDKSVFCYGNPVRQYVQNSLPKQPCSDLVKTNPPQYRYLCAEAAANAHQGYYGDDINDYIMESKPYGHPNGYYDNYNNYINSVLFIGLESIVLMISCLFGIFCGFCIAMYYYFIFKKKD